MIFPKPEQKPLAEPAAKAIKRQPIKAINSKIAETINNILEHFLQVKHSLDFIIQKRITSKTIAIDKTAKPEIKTIIEPILPIEKASSAELDNFVKNEKFS